MLQYHLVIPGGQYLPEALFLQNLNPSQGVPEGLLVPDILEGQVLRLLQYLPEIPELQYVPEVLFLQNLNPSQGAPVDPGYQVVRFVLGVLGVLFDPLLSPEDQLDPVNHHKVSLPIYEFHYLS